MSDAGKQRELDELFLLDLSACHPCITGGISPSISFSHATLEKVHSTWQLPTSPVGFASPSGPTHGAHVQCTAAGWPVMTPPQPVVEMAVGSLPLMVSWTTSTGSAGGSAEQPQLQAEGGSSSHAAYDVSLCEYRFPQARYSDAVTEQSGSAGQADWQPAPGQRAAGDNAAQTTSGTIENAVLTSRRASTLRTPIKGVKGSRRRSQARQHGCPVCKQGFARAHDLKRHVAIHEKERLFPCSLCSKKFVRKDALKRHMDVRGPLHDDFTKKASPKERKPRAPRPQRLVRDRLPSLPHVFDPAPLGAQENESATQYQPIPYSYRFPITSDGSSIQSGFTSVIGSPISSAAYLDIASPVSHAGSSTSVNAPYYFGLPSDCIPLMYTVDLQPIGGGQ